MRLGAVIVQTWQCGPHLGRLAQLVRVLPSHGRGHWFKSSIAHQELMLFEIRRCDITGLVTLLTDELRMNALRSNRGDVRINKAAISRNI